MTQVQQWSPELLQQFKNWDQDKQGRTLFLEQHPDYPAYLLVSSFDPLFVHTLKDHLGEYRAVHKLKVEALLKTAEAEGFENVFLTSDPDELYLFLKGLDDPYPYGLNFKLKQFQLRGFNYTKDLPSAIINWSTGTGKSVYAVARIKYLLESDRIDKVVILSKSHNKINWQRTLTEKGSLDSTRDDEATGGTPDARRGSRERLYESSDIFIVNYEKLRFRPDEKASYDVNGRKRPAPSGDGQEILAAIEGKRVLWVWDEMPSKMKSMKTAWYKGAERLLRKTQENYQIELTATKLETDPENVYVCTKLLDKSIWPNLATFRSSYAKRMSDFSPWQVAAWDRGKLPELGMRLAHITHIANKYTDPVIRAEFPIDHWEDVIIDLSDQDRKLYDAVENDIIEDLSGDYNTILTKILPLQLICNNPALINQSEGALAQAFAQRYSFTDKHCAKLNVLLDMIQEIDGKIVVFTMYSNLGTSMLMQHMVQRRIPTVLYSGNAQVLQDAQDRFRSDPRIKVFLSSDKGSDSIDLESASSVINYDLPWNYSTLTQRVNRISRLTSKTDHVFYYNLVCAGTIEDRKRAILNRKRQMELAIDTHVLEQSEIISKTSLDDLRWILTG